jgi:Arc/MetJ family transcription regulator
MRTTINIDDALFERLMAIAGTRTKTDAVNWALKEFLRLKAKDELLDLRGKLELEENWEQLREAEKNEL